MAQTDAPPAGLEPDVLETPLEIDGRGWVVRVLGRSGGSGPGRTPLLLLGFWEVDVDAADGDPARERLVVGRTLSGLSTTILEHALSRAMPYSPERRPVEIFADTSERRRR